MKTNSKTFSSESASKKAKKKSSQSFNEAMTINKISSYRKKQGLRQVDLAALIGCDSVTISRYENGLRDPSLEYAIRLARLFNCPMEELFGLSEDLQN